MVTISLDPTTTQQSGGITLTGTVSSGAVVSWWLNDTLTYFTDGLNVNGIFWQLDVPLIGNTFVISVQASLNGEISEVVKYTFRSEAGEILPSFEFNSVDELALANGIDRIPGETNESLIARAKDVYLKPGDSTLLGQHRGLYRDLGLPSMEEFFFLSVRFNPLTNSIYKNVYVGFNRSYAEVQVSDWRIVDEMVTFDIATDTFEVAHTIGSEFPEYDQTIRVINSGQAIPDNAITVVGPNTIRIDSNIVEVNTNSVLTASYPYKKVIAYSYLHATTKEKKLRSVLDLQQWLTNEVTVLENGVQVPLVLWRDGRYEEVAPHDDIVTIFSSDFLMNNSIGNTTTRYKVLDKPGGTFYDYISDYASKAGFSATQIHPAPFHLLDELPTSYIGNWGVFNSMGDREFQDTFKAEEEYVNLVSYAKRLRTMLRLGMKNALVNSDYWDSDTPELIGDNYLPARYDRGVGTHSVLANSGDTLRLTLLERKYYADLLRSQSL